MGKRLIVAEKPSVGRNIAKVLGCRRRVDGTQEKWLETPPWRLKRLK